MNVLIDNYSGQKVAETRQGKIVCDRCGSMLQYDEHDINIGAFGCANVICPLCGCENYIEDDKYDMKLSMYNVEFPKHFYYTSTETGAVDCCNNDEVKEAIIRAIEHLRKHREHTWITTLGNLFVLVQRFDIDEIYEVFVTNNYYETSIPFENEDY